MIGVRIEAAGAYLTKDGGMLAATIREMRFAVVIAETDDDVGALIALFARREDAEEFVANYEYENVK